MSYWDGKKVVRFPPKDCPEYPKWEVVDCGCCNGIRWGGEYPDECDTCSGGGVIYRLKKTGAFALYPGGPFCG